MQAKIFGALVGALGLISFAGPAWAGGTMTFSSLSGSPYSYTEGGFRVYSRYGGGSGHIHAGSGGLSNHTSCCSTPYRFEKVGGGTFSMTQLQDVSASGTLVSSSGASFNLGSTSGTVTLPSGFSNVTYVDWNAGGGVVDNVVWNDCSVNADAGGPYSVDEGSSVTVSASGSSSSGGSISSYGWDLSSGGGGPFTDATGATASYSAAGVDGTSTVTIGVSVSCGTTTATDTATVNVANVAPSVAITVPATGDEGTAVSFGSTASDPGPDTLTYSWNFGDGNTSTSANPAHTYADDGTYSVSLTVGDGETSTTTTGSITIANVAPSIATVTGPTQGDEGSTLTFAAAATDPGTIDAATLNYSWDWGDGSSGSGTSPSHAWDDDDGAAGASPYTVTLTVTDPQGATAVSTLTVAIDNVAPSITSSAPGTALEGTLWSYSAASSDPGSDTPVWSLSPSAPASMTLDTATGLVEWTPVYADVGQVSFTLTVDDGDGGQDVQTVTIVVDFVDSEPDGIADSWETSNGLDPTTDDSALDPDGDGLSNLDEFLAGTDPNGFDGPDVPVQTAPITGGEVDDSRPILTWDAANDPNGDVLTYDVEVYDDAAMTTLITSVTGEAGLQWQVDTPLTENNDRFWRVRAADPYVAGSWSPVEGFFINEINEAPGLPTALYPVGGETVTVARPETQLGEATDPDRDALGYRIRIWLEDQVLTEGWLDPLARDVSWVVDIDLDEDTLYGWDARAEDEHGLEGAWTDPETFFVSTDDAAPTGVRFIDPLDGDMIESTSPGLEATEGEDPEGTDLTYVFELDTTDAFSSGELYTATLPATGMGSVLLDLQTEGHTLSDNTLWWARVRAEDEAGVGSAWDTISFFVRGGNDAPPTPALLSPEDGAVLATASPTVAIGHVDDPEGDTVFYEITVARDAELTDVVGTVTDLVESSGPEGTVDQTSWELTARVNGTFYWSARAVDEFGAASEWAEAWSFSFDDSDPARPETPEDCSCDSSLADASNAPALALLLLLVPALRRRR